jgi:hypothetical protein
MGGVSGMQSYSPPTIEAWNDYCDLYDANVQRCYPEFADQFSMCPSASCLAAVYDESALLDVVACQSVKDCDTFFMDDDCVDSAGGGLDAAGQAFLDACRARITECASTANGYCASALPIIRSTIRNGVAACLERPCAELDACLDALQIPDCWE